MASLFAKVMRQVEHHPRSWESRHVSELSKEISKKPFFFKMICHHAFYVIETNRNGKSTGHPEFSIKNISIALPDVCHGLVKRFRIQITEKLTYLAP
ncbi:hypothetical protein CcaCcLH18_10917 [Colletotrichum camelliae]|nr:hypothetical protein CcaCcLH18_10917 [Colletotrichum camelliae]